MAISNDLGLDGTQSEESRIATRQFACRQLKAGYNPPLLSGDPSLPAELNAHAVAQTSVTRTPAGTAVLPTATKPITAAASASTLSSVLMVAAAATGAGAERGAAVAERDAAAGAAEAPASRWPG